MVGAEPRAGPVAHARVEGNAHDPHIGFDAGTGRADLVEAGSVAAARSAGKARIEGKDYVMQDGDVVEFRFNV